MMLFIITSNGVTYLLLRGITDITEKWSVCTTRRFYYP